MKCKYCGKLCKNLNSLRQHEIRCKFNEDRIDLTYLAQNRLALAKKANYSNQFIKAKKLNQPIPQVSQSTKNKISKKMSGRVMSQEEKSNRSIAMQKAVLDHPESYSSSNVNGRVKKINYRGIILDSSWEKIVAEYLDSKNIKWIRPTSYFEYIWENKTHKYFSDFYLPEYDKYIEVKGYIRKRDEAKWKNMNNLIIITKNEINDILNSKYSLDV